MSFKEKTIAMRKNPAAYHVSRSAVKKTQKWKRGMAAKRHNKPAMVAIRGFLKKRIVTRLTKKSMSCGFM